MFGLVIFTIVKFVLNIVNISSKDNQLYGGLEIFKIFKYMIFSKKYHYQICP